MRRIITIILAVLMIAGVATSCGGEKEKKDLIIGTWSLESVTTLDGEIVTDAEDLEGAPNFQFTKDGKLNIVVVVPMNITVYVGTYSVKGDVLKITLDETQLNNLMFYLGEDNPELLAGLIMIFGSGIPIKKLTETRLQLQPVAPEELEVEENEMVLINFKKI